jgi:hypothetical protein
VLAELPDNETVDLIVFGLGKNYREYTVSHGRRKGDWCFSWEADAPVENTYGEIAFASEEPSNV